MADDVKVSALPAAGSLDGTETVPVVKGGVTRRTTVDDIRSIARPIIVRRTSGDITLAVSATFVDSDTTGTASARTLDLVFPGAAAGDVIVVEPNIYMPSAANGTVHTFATIVAGAVVNRAGGAFGVPTWSAPAAGIGKIIGAYSYVVQAGDVEAGGVRVRMQHIIASATRTMKADTNTEFYLEGRGPFA